MVSRVERERVALIIVAQPSLGRLDFLINNVQDAVVNALVGFNLQQELPINMN